MVSGRCGSGVWEVLQWCLGGAAVVFGGAVVIAREYTPVVSGMFCSDIWKIPLWYLDVLGVWEVLRWCLGRAVGISGGCSSDI